MKLSVLDQSVISKGASAKIALQNTIKLAQVTETLGYNRFWVAEHHNSNGLAGSAPEVLITRIASATKRIRVGSGGVLLPQYSPYKVAEDFKVLEALFPNRIDLGIGRSPGGSPATRMALTDGERKSMNEFPRQIIDLQRFLTNSLPKEHPFHEVQAFPLIDTLPQMWVLGISHRGARVAAENGTAFTYGHFITPINGKRAVDYYYDNFQASAFNPNPKVNVCIFVVCASTQERAEELALSQDLWLLSVEQANDTRIPAIEEAKRRVLTSEEKQKLRINRRRCIVGTPDKVKRELLALIEIYQTDEFMIITNIHPFEDKIRSYMLLAEAFQL